jgi:hypothetical protein
MHVNVCTYKTENNRPLKISEIKVALPKLAVEIANADKVVALGKTAAKALTLLGVTFYEMPHPSPRNRLLNNSKYVEQKVKGLVSFCNQPGLNTE